MQFIIITRKYYHEILNSLAAWVTVAAAYTVTGFRRHLLLERESEAERERIGGVVSLASA